MRSEDMIMPRLKLAHGMSQVVQQGVMVPGRYYLTGRNQDLGDTVYIIPVDMTMSRSMYTQKEGLLCRSFDMMQGVGDPGIACEGTQEEIDDPELREEDRGCMFRLWTVNETTGRRVPPPCGKGYNYPVLVVIPDDDGELENGQVFQAMTTLRGMSTPAAKQMNTAVGTVDQPCWHENVFELATVDKQTSYGMSKTTSAKWLGITPDNLMKKAEAYARIAGAPDFVRANLEAEATESE